MGWGGFALPASLRGLRLRCVVSQLEPRGTREGYASSNESWSDAVQPRRPAKHHKAMLGINHSDKGGGAAHPPAPSARTDASNVVRDEGTKRRHTPPRPNTSSPPTYFDEMSWPPG